MNAAHIRHYAVALECLSRIQGQEVEDLCGRIRSQIDMLLAADETEALKIAHPDHVAQAQQQDDEIPF